MTDPAGLETDSSGGLVTNGSVARAVALLMESESRSAEGALEILEARAHQQHLGLSEASQVIIDALAATDTQTDVPDGFADRILNRSREG